jgi:hypothetical protein
VASRRYRSKSSLNSNLADINSKISEISKRPDTRKIADESITNVSIKEASIVGQNLADESITKSKLANDVYSNPIFTGLIVGSPAEPNADSNTAKSIGYVGMPQVILGSGGLTLSRLHAGEHIYVTGAGQTVTIPANDSVPFEIGTRIVVINAGVTSTIAITTDTLRLAGTTTTGNRTLAAHGMATLIKITATSWIISGNGIS